MYNSHCTASTRTLYRIRKVRLLQSQSFRLDKGLCRAYHKLLAWEDESPFDCPVDGDNPEHIMWIMNRACARAEEFNIPTGPIDFRKTQGVVKNIIPAVASTNAVIAAQVL